MSDIDWMAKAIRLTKEGIVEDDPSDPDIMTTIHMFRDGESLGVIMIPSDRDQMLGVCKLAIVGIGVDEIACSFESYHTPHPNNPMTGKEWESGEMQRMAIEHPESLEKGWVSEAVLSTSYARNGDLAAIHQPYKIVGNKVEWGEKIVMDDPTSFYGYVTDTIKSFFNEPTMLSMVEAAAEELKIQFRIDDASELTLAHKQAMCEAACYGRLKSMVGRAMVVLHLVPGSEREKYLRQQLEELGLQHMLADPQTGVMFGNN